MNHAAKRFATLARAVGPVAVVALGAAVLLRFPPGEYSFYPQCPVYASLHLECPGCGTTRALAALLHGDVAEALRLNALTTMLLPFVAGYAAICYGRWLRRERVPQLPHAGIYAMLAVAVVFMVLRNLPVGLL